MQIRNKYSIFRLTIISLAACISALGTIPYGFEFAHFFKSYSYLIFISAGILFAATSALANAILGIYSFLNAQSDHKFTHHLGAKCLSFLSAVPVGFMSYYGYDEIFPLMINLVFACTVTLINAAIAYTAILNLSKEISSWSVNVKTRSEAIIRITGFVVGAIVSLVAYMAATHGLTELLNSMHYFTSESAFTLACVIGFIAWMPYAALFANATQVFAGKSYYFISHFLSQKRLVNLTSVLIFIFSLCSGTAFAQIAIVFFDPAMNIPAIVKTVQMQNFIYHVLIPFAFISSVAVNYLALKNLFNEFIDN